MCKMPYGIQDFKEIRLNNYMYIDKTKYIEVLEQTGRKTVHLLRPRRFGKTLFTSMLNAYYDVNGKAEFDKLFKGTYIYDHPTKERNGYYMLRFDFSGLNTDNIEELKAEFYERVKSNCLKFIERYQIDIELTDTTSAASYLSNFIDRVSIKLSEPIYVIIDEYDHFANELLSFRFDDFKDAVSKNGYVRKFYEVLKTGAVDSTIGKIFITGVSPIAMDSMTSGFNISTNYTLDARFNEALGFTSEEMKCLISNIDGITDQEKTLLDMKQIYDGYMFSRSGQHHIFNPNMALYYLDYVQSFQIPPDDIVDPNIYSDYKKIENLLYIKPATEQKEALMTIMSEEKIYCHLTKSYELSKQFTRDDFVSLLFYLGYLTFRGARGMRYELSVPNEVMKNVYFDYFRKMSENEYQIDTSDYLTATESIIYEKDNELFVKQMEEILYMLDNRDYIKFHERDTKIAAMAITKTNASILVKSEYPVPEGYIDLALFPYQTEGTIALIELKYIKRDEYSDMIRKVKRDEALEELEKYKLAKEFQNVDVVKWILIFSKNKCVWNERVD